MTELSQTSAGGKNSWKPTEISLHYSAKVEAISLSFPTTKKELKECCVPRSFVEKK
jgi:hypothetical protein